MTFLYQNYALILSSFIFTLPFLCKNSDAIKYYLKFLLAYVYVVITCTVLIPVAVIYPSDITNLTLAARFCKYAKYIVGVQWELRGMEYWDTEQCYIVVANHQSSLDVLGMFEMWPRMRRCTVVASKALMFLGGFGFGAWLSGLVFIERMNTETSILKLREATSCAIKNKTKLWVFPEGHRFNTSTIQPFKKGAFHLAVNHQIPILPVVFSRYHFLDSESKKFKSGKVTITTLPPIATKGMTRADIESLSEKTRQQMIQVFKNISE